MTIPVAVIGCGAIAQAHLTALQGNAACQLAGVYDVDPARAQAAAARIPGTRVYPSWHAVLAAPDVAAVDLCLPHNLHATMALEAMAAGKHVFVEKPMSTTVEEGRRMVAAAREFRRVLMPGHTKLFVPALQQAKKIIDAGGLGTIYLVKTNIIQGPGAFTDRPWWMEAGAGGGAGIGNTIHHTAAVRWLVGDVDEVMAYTGRLVVRDMADEDTLAMLLHFRDGAIGDITTGMGSRWGGHEERISIYGSEGWITFVDGGLQAVSPSYFGNPNIQIVPIERSSPFKGLLEEFGRAIAEQRAPSITPDDGVRAVELIEAAYRSAREHRPVRLPLP